MLMLGVLAVAAIGAGCYVLGRVTAGNGNGGYRQGRVDGYLAGLHDGTAQGLEQGRSAQEVAGLPANARAAAQQAFDDGYAAGANDVFAGYDGGWALHVPWIITLSGGSGQVVYRIQGREQVEPGTDYYLCADGHSLCHEPRR